MVTTTGSGVAGLIDGLPNAMIATPGSLVGPTITWVTGDPNDVVHSAVTSGIAIDWVGETVYMCELAGGSTWIKLGSTT